MPKIELADIFKKHGPEYKLTHSLNAQQAKVIGSITKCRTAALGGHLCACTECGCTKVFYNSCRDRHCPKCQSLATERWLLKRRAELLPVRHFHVVFTIPPALHNLFRYNERRCYGALFRQSWSSLKTLAADEKHLGAAAGAMSVLHTWGQNLHYHPHIHMLVPAGGLSFSGDRWQQPKHKNYLVPVPALSRLFRGRLVSKVRELHREKKLRLPPGERLGSILNAAMSRDWVVYAKPPFSGPDKLVGYLGRYVKRIAIGNERIRSMSQGRVRFNYRDYADGNRRKVMDLSATEFIRRFVQHILPGGFCKVRYYGLLATRNRQTRLAKCHRLLGRKYERPPKYTWQEIYFMVTGREAETCEACGGRTVVVDYLRPDRAPPDWSRINRTPSSSPALHPLAA